MPDSDSAADTHYTTVPITALRPFKNHPFRVVEDDTLHSLADSIRRDGIYTPLLVRPQEDMYEIISGHRRFRAAGLAGLSEIPVIIRNLDDDSAIIMMVDSNLQRESLLPSERAKAYKMKMEAMRHQGKRSDLTSGQVGPKLIGRSNQLIASESGESAKQVQRYIRLTNLIPDLLNRVDSKQLAFVPAVELSYLSEEEQHDLMDLICPAKIVPSLSQAQQLKKLSKAGEFTSETARNILFPSPDPKHPIFPKSSVPSLPSVPKSSISSPPPSDSDHEPVRSAPSPKVNAPPAKGYIISDTDPSYSSEIPPTTPEEVLYELNDAIDDMLYRWRRSYTLHNEILSVPEHAQHVKEMLGAFYSEIDKIMKEKCAL